MTDEERKLQEEQLKELRKIIEYWEEKNETNNK